MRRTAEAEKSEATQILREAQSTAHQARLRAEQLETLAAQVKINPLEQPSAVPPDFMDTPDTSIAEGVARMIKPALKLADLKKYKGERKDGACEQWILDAKNHMRAYIVMSGVTPSDPQQVAYLSQYLEGSALKWWSNLTHLAEHNLGGPLPQTPTSFYQILMEAFGDSHSNERRRDRWETLKQKGTVREFANQLLQDWVFLVPMPDQYEVLRRFRAGLEWDVRAKMEADYSDIMELFTYINKADDVDRMLSRLKQLKKSHYTTFPFRPDRRPNSGTIHGIETMPNRSSDPKAFQQWCIQNKRCFNCGSGEHISRSCPSPPTASRSPILVDEEVVAGVCAVEVGEEEEAPFARTGSRREKPGISEQPGPARRCE